MSDAELTFAEVAFSKVARGEEITLKDMKRIIGVLEMPGIKIAQLTPEELSGAQAHLLSFLNQWQSAIQQQQQ